MRGERGQATVEYAAIALLVALVLAAVSLVAAGPALGRAVTRELARGLCVVRGGDCARDREPCVVSSRASATSGVLRAAVFRVGGGRTRLVEQGSDGGWSLTEVMESDGGLELGIGAEAGLSLGAGLALALGGEARAAVLAHSRSGRVWRRRSQRGVEHVRHMLDERPDELVRAVGADGRWTWVLRSHDPPPDEVFGERGWSVSLGGGASAGPAQGALDLRAEDAWGTRRIVRSGHRVMYVRPSRGYAAVVGGSMRGKSLRGSAGASEEELYAVEVDRRGRPLALTLVQAGELRGARSLPASVSGQTGRLLAAASAAGPGRRAFEVVRHLDLTVPENLAAARGALAQITSPRPHFGPAVAAAAALEERIAAAGVVHARVHALDESVIGASATGSAGVRAGAGFEHRSRATRLLAALTRGPDGTWSSRGDCA